MGHTSAMQLQILTAPATSDANAAHHQVQKATGRTVCAVQNGKSQTTMQLGGLAFLITGNMLARMALQKAAPSIFAGGRP